MSKQIKISDGLVISRAWLEKYKTKIETGNYVPELAQGAIAAIVDISKNSTPLIDVASVSWDDGCSVGFNRGRNAQRGVCLRPEQPTGKQEFINSTIEIDK